MEWKKLAPWNWFQKEQESVGSTVPVVHGSRSDPFSVLRAEMDRVFGSVLGHSGVGPARPRLDISEGKRSYTIRIEMPGVEKGDVKIGVHGDALWIQGEKRQEREESDEDYHCIERSFGAFERVLSLPDDADLDGIDARFRSGVLKITIQKRKLSRPEPRAIEIRHE